MEVLKKYYATLCHSLPADYKKCLNALYTMGYAVPQAFANKLKSCGSSQKTRQYVLDLLIRYIDSEEGVLDICDVIDTMVEDDEMKPYIESFRNGMSM